MDGMLSQDEINALLSGMNSGSGDTSTAEADSASSSDDGFSLSATEKDAVGEISNISMGTAATTLSSLLNQKVNITTPSVSVSDWDDISTMYDRPCVMMQISYKEGIDGNNVLILREDDVKIITDLMMGGPGKANDEPLSELHLSAIGEAMNQMMGSAATSMSSMFNRKIDISPPVANVIDAYSESVDNLPAFLNGSFVKVSFKMQIGDLIDSEIMQLYPIEFAKELIELFMPSGGSAQPAPQPAPAAQSAPQPAPQTTPQPAPQPAPAQDMGAAQGMPYGGAQGMPYGYPPQGMPYPYPPQGMPYGYPPQQDVNVSPAAFQPFSGNLSALTQKENIDLIMDVPLEVTVELGRTQKSIKDILEFAPGTIVELNKIAGEAIDVLVNGKYVAKGEVVVIEESFGVRITEIIKDK
ncbi:MAG: flagellar motor switch phosphatase FliY [Lachnospira sp.]|nr:flagellar motor switch phosphatase FliY [Lachnospira sp.]